MKLLLRGKPLGPHEIAAEFVKNRWSSVPYGTLAFLKREGSIVKDNGKYSMTKAGKQKYGGAA